MAPISAFRWLALQLALFAPSLCITLDLRSPESIKQAASTVAWDMMSMYRGNYSGQTPGLLPNSGSYYYWWEAGAMFGAMIDYWYFTGDASYNDVTSQALLFQVGEYNNYEPVNQTLQLGNDDQAFWAMAAMTAAEQRFPNPPPSQPQWLALAQAVFNRQQPRWDTQHCNGGLRWQFFPVNNGYNYKNSISNGCFFNLGARLGKYTGNQTYLDWAEETWEWSDAIGLIDQRYNVFDGVNIADNCSTVNPLQWTYNVGVYMYGAAAMWNATAGDVARQAVWRTRVQGLLNATKLFLPNETRGIMVEVACENLGTCNVDQHSFKAYLSRFLADTAIVAPWTFDQIKPILETSAAAAARACTGGDRGTLCGFKWTTGTFDGTSGIGQQMNALEVIQSNLLTEVAPPVTQSNGGISRGNPGAGTGDPDALARLTYVRPITTADKAGAGLVTAVLLLGTLVAAIWAMFFD